MQATWSWSGAEAPCWPFMQGLQPACRVQQLKKGQRRILAKSCSLTP